MHRTPRWMTGTGLDETGSLNQADEGVSSSPRSSKILASSYFFYPFNAAAMIGGSLK